MSIFREQISFRPRAAHPSADERDTLSAQKLNYDQPVKLAEDVCWAGFVDETAGFVAITT